MLGFARFKLGSDPASNLVELVRQPGTPQDAIDAAKEAFEAAGLKVAVSKDVPGRIVNRLIRPYYNAALRRCGWCGRSSSLSRTETGSSERQRASDRPAGLGAMTRYQAQAVASSKPSAKMRSFLRRARPKRLLPGCPLPAGPIFVCPQPGCSLFACPHFPVNGG